MREVGLGISIMIGGVVGRWVMIGEETPIESMRYRGVGVGMLIITVIIIPMCIMVVSTQGGTSRGGEWRGLIIIEVILIMIWGVRDIGSYYVLFEIIIIPMYIRIMRGGNRERKKEAGNKLIIYSIMGSFGLLIAIIRIMRERGTTDMEYIGGEGGIGSIEWWLIMIPFAVKIPMIPYYIWLPVVHVDSPTEGSMILAGLILKLGGYGMMRMNVEMMTEEMEREIGIMETLGVISIILGGISMMRQNDIKKVIAYSSIVHMNMGVISIMIKEMNGLIGGVIEMIAHGIVSSGLFMLTGILYKRYKTKNIYDYSGLMNTMPLYSTLLMTMIMGNIGFPLTINFIGELKIVYGLILSNIYTGIIYIIMMLIYSGTNIWYMVRLIYNRSTETIIKYKDLSLNELLILSILTILMLLLGIKPNWIIEIIRIPIMNMSAIYN